MRLWFAQVMSSIGDWIGIVAILAMASRLSNERESAVASVMAARLLPGLLLAPVGGLLVDRWNRRTTLIYCSVGRACITASLPFIETLPSLFVASFGLEVLALWWSLAKDASIPDLVPKHKLASVNALSLAAAYGTFPIGSALFALMANVPRWLNAAPALSWLGVNQESAALWLSAVAYLLPVYVLVSLPLGRRPTRTGPRSTGSRTWRAASRELREGISLVLSNNMVRPVVLGSGAAIIGCGAVVPLGPIHVTEVLRAGSAGFGLLMFGLGAGAAIAVVALLLVRRDLDYRKLFTTAVFGSALTVMFAAGAPSLISAVVMTALLGMFAGGGYVTAFTLVQNHVDDVMRGRALAALYTSMRLCLFVALAAAPLLASALGSLAIKIWPTSTLVVGNYELRLNGTRLALWFAGCQTFLVGLLVHRDMKRCKAEGG